MDEIRLINGQHFSLAKSWFWKTLDLTIVQRKYFRSSSTPKHESGYSGLIKEIMGNLRASQKAPMVGICAVQPIYQSH